MRKCSVGIDFGTLSARALVAEIGTGRELASASKEYRHGVMDDFLSDGQRLMPDWALQDPQDYLECLRVVIREALVRAEADPKDVVGLGVDFTSCTTMPVDEHLAPLCGKPEFAGNPSAYVKLWKDHAAQDKANRMTEVARRRGERFLERYGGKVSSEWALPKAWQLLDDAPEVYAAAYRIIEAGDWLVSLLVGREVRSCSMAGYKAFWNARDGYPSREFLRELDPRLEGYGEKLGPAPLPLGDRAGCLTEEGAELTGLLPGTPVSVPCIDAHAAMAAAGLVRAGDMQMIMGTSTGHIMLADDEKIVPGICGVVQNGAIPGLAAYEAGQCCVGDHFNWFVENCTPENYAKEAAERGIGLHQLLTEKAARQKPGESGLLALDWWNGNRSVLVNANLTGLMLGMTLTTRAEDIYRALIEATAYGTRMIIENFERHGVPIRGLYACGGIARKNPFAMQIYADVCNREICIARSDQGSALGSAIFGALAAGSARGGYDDIADAVEMGGVEERRYVPDPENVLVYEKLYREYEALHDYFGRGGSDVMKRLKQIKEDQRRG